MEREIILVPFDFTETSYNAITHAAQLSKAADDKILLLHVLPKEGLFPKKYSEEELQEANKELEDIVKETEKNYNVKPDIKILEGSLKKTIKEISLIRNINLIVMGEHYKVGHHSISAYEVINLLRVNKTKNVIPLIVVETEPAHSHYIEIVVPFDYKREFKETLRWVMHLSKYYQCNINFLKPFYSDPEKKKLMANNLYFTKKMLDSNNIIYGIKTARRSKKYRDEVFRFANDIDADLIVIMSDKYKEYVAEGKHKNDTNPRKIPVMCIKPLPKKFQQFF